MNHKWKKDKDFKPHDGYYEKYTCTTCGCIKTKHAMRDNGSTFHDEFYERSGQSFGFRSSAGYIPECIDWNDNTLD